MEFKVLKGLKFIPNVRHPGVLWTKRHTNPLSFGANFVKKKLWWIMGVKKHANLLSFAAGTEN